MFTQLVESRRTVQRSRGGMAASVVVHAALLGGAIVATARASGAPEHAPAPPVVYVDVPATPPAPHGASGHAGHGGARPAVPVDPLPDPVHFGPAPIHLSTPGISLDTLISTIPTDAGAWGRAGARESGAGDGAPWDAGLVDRPAEGVAGNPAPVYPEALREAAVEGTVEARFVIDTTGRVEPGSIAFDPGTDALFAAAVRRALSRSRFTPAEARGRRVRVLVRQAFAFRITR